MTDRFHAYEASLSTPSLDPTTRDSTCLALHMFAKYYSVIVGSWVLRLFAALELFLKKVVLVGLTVFRLTMTLHGYTLLSGISTLADKVHLDTRPTQLRIFSYLHDILILGCRIIASPQPSRLLTFLLLAR